MLYPIVVFFLRYIIGVIFNMLPFMFSIKYNRKLDGVNCNITRITYFISSMVLTVVRTDVFFESIRLKHPTFYIKKITRRVHYYYTIILYIILYYIIIIVYETNLIGFLRHESARRLMITIIIHSL